MKTVTLEVVSLGESLAEFKTAWKDGKATGARIGFATPELLWKVLSEKRWEILKSLTGAGPISIREVARRVGRDVKAVHGDVRALLDAGVINKTEDGKIEFGFDAIRVNFTLKAA